MNRAADSDIAILGIACRVAGANSPSALWDNLASAKDVQSDITRFNIDGYYHPEGGSRKGLTNVRKAYMLNDDSIDKFDNAFFYTTPLEAEAMDPQQRMLLEVAYEAIENAGIPLENFRGTDTAVFAGMEGCDYHTIACRDLDMTPRYLATGTPTCMAANRLSYFFDLSGPSMSVDTACSSSMAALHQAVRTLQHGDSKMAIVCGAKLILNPDMFIPSSELGFLSPTGKCRSFDKSANGYGRGEGVLALLLKPLKLAIADNDPIRAIIKGTRLNQDGRTKGITLPSVDAQKGNMQSLYEELNLSPAKIQYLEAHGTGTSAGDPLEFSAINLVYGGSRQTAAPLVVGSIKSNIGHLEASSALASMIKVTMCLERGQIPAQMHLDNPNPDIDFSNVDIPTEVLPWPSPEGNVRIAAINTFGAGGTNGHAVVEAFPKAFSTTSSEVRRPFLFKVSAADDVSLREIRLRYAEYLDKHQPALQDLAHTLLSRRSTLGKSVFFTAHTADEVIENMRRDTLNILKRSGEGNSKIVFLFTGQGAQWPQMGKSLISQSPLFNAVMIECEHHLSVLPDGPPWSIIRELQKGKESSKIYTAEYSQLLCTALQLGLVVLLKSWGLAAEAVVGHSSGEIAAAYAAGRISMRDAIVISYYRGLVLGNAAHKTSGSMCAVGLGEDEAEAIVKSYANRVRVAAVNSPNSCTLSGDRDAIREIVNQQTKEKHFCRELRVDQAYHSFHMLPLAPRYLEKLSRANLGLGLGLPQCPMFSSLTGKRLESRQLASSYWVRNMTSTVNYFPALQSCLESFPDTSAFVEIGPHPALKGPSQEILGAADKTPINYFHTCIRNQDSFEGLLRIVGAMVASSLPVEASKVNAYEIINGLNCQHQIGNVLTDLPSYQWNHSIGFWAESSVSRNVRFRRFPRHQLLGSRYLDDIPIRPSWRNHIILKEIPWLHELKDNGSLEVPPTAYILMALEAVRQLAIISNSKAASLAIRDVEFQSPLTFSTIVHVDNGLEVQLIATQDEKHPAVFHFDIFSACSSTEDSWIRHCSGKFEWLIGFQKPNHVYEQEIKPDTSLLEQARVYAHELCHHLSGIKVDRTGSIGSFNRSANNLENYPIHPPVLEAILGLPPASLTGQSLPARYRLQSVKSLVVPPETPDGLSEALFAIAIKTCNHYATTCNIDVCQSNKAIYMEGVEYEATELIRQAPTKSSLFFKPVLLPDITKLDYANSGVKIRTLPELAELLTHKWPMLDLVINVTAKNDVMDILRAFNVLTPEQRSYCRSVQCVGERFRSAPDCIQFVDGLEAACKCHVFFTDQDLEAEQALEKLRPNGFVCNRRCIAHIVEADFLDPVSDIHGSTSGHWSVWKSAFSVPRVPEGRKIVIFTNVNVTLGTPALANAEHIPLDPHNVASFCQRRLTERFDAIVVDNEQRPIITTWSGKDLMPWFQVVMKSANALLWVTKEYDQSPFNNVAGSLLRTLQSEKPSVLVRWLIFYSCKEEYNNWHAEFDLKLEQTYTEMLGEENELQIRDASSARPEILRYYPDDDLSAKVGLIPPRISETPLGASDYSLVFAAPREPVIMSADPVVPKDSGKTTRVQVEAAVIDIEDLRLFSGMQTQRTSPSRYGTFFAGRVAICDKGRESEDHIVGWHPEHTHRKSLEYLPHFCALRDRESSPVEAASAHAATVVASCIVDGAARARPGETVLIDFEGPIQEAIEQICAQISVVTVDSAAGSNADFLVTFNKSDGVLVNGQQIDIYKYMHSEQGRNMVRDNWNRFNSMSPQVKAFELKDIRQAFESVQDPFSTVLIHYTESNSRSNHVPIYQKPTRLFSAEGEYVLIGGLGGLGRYICSWMVENGAMHLTIICRSGIKDQGIERAIEALKSAGASLRIIRADACDREALARSLTQVREERPIKGVINLAMMLGDSPMATMTGEEWDRAIRVKIDSCWNLHEETVEDSLDFFILFSSIASVLGNRNQGNYNVANTFLNALAEYRQWRNLPGISIALGAMTDIGVLYDLSKPDMLQTLSRSGLTHLTRHHLAKVMEAAVLESPRRYGRSLIVTGLEMFEREKDGSFAGRTEPLFWTELPEFGHLHRYKKAVKNSKSKNNDSKLPVKERLDQLRKNGNIKDLQDAVMNAFLVFLSRSLGFAADISDPQQALATYGVDSLSGVACQYWFHQELSIDVPVQKILSGASIAEIVEGTCGQLRNAS